MKSLEPKEVKDLSNAMNYQQRPSSNFKKTDAKVFITEQNDLKAKIGRYQSKYVLNSSHLTAI